MGAMSMNGGGAAKAHNPSAMSLMDGSFSDLGLGSLAPAEKKPTGFGSSMTGPQASGPAPPMSGKDIFSSCDPFKVAA
jgi:hypothetical protein